MGDTVEALLERMVPELEDAIAKGTLSEAEARAIVAKRRDFEYLLVRRSPRRRDFLRYVAYEVNLDTLRRKRRERLGIRKTTLSDHGSVQRIHYIFDRATRKWPGDLELWAQHIDFCLRAGSAKTLAKLFPRVLQLHPHEAGMWIRAASWEFDHNKSYEAARVLMQRALRVNAGSEELWLAYFRLELLHVRRLQARRAVLGLGLGADTVDEASEAAAAESVAGGEGGGAAAARRAILQGAVAVIVFNNALAAQPDGGSVRFRQRFLDTCASLVPLPTASAAAAAAEPSGKDGATPSTLAAGAAFAHVEASIIRTLERDFPADAAAVAARALQPARRALAALKRAGLRPRIVGGSGSAAFSAPSAAAEAAADPDAGASDDALFVVDTSPGGSFGGGEHAAAATAAAVATRDTGHDDAGGTASTPAAKRGREVEEDAAADADATAVGGSATPPASGEGLSSIADLCARAAQGKAALSAGVASAARRMPSELAALAESLTRACDAADAEFTKAVAAAAAGDAAPRGSLTATGAGNQTGGGRAGGRHGGAGAGAGAGGAATEAGKLDAVALYEQWSACVGAVANELEGVGRFVGTDRADPVAFAITHLWTQLAQCAASAARAGASTPQVALRRVSALLHLAARSDGDASRRSSHLVAAFKAAFKACKLFPADAELWLARADLMLAGASVGAPSAAVVDARTDCANMLLRALGVSIPAVAARASAAPLRASGATASGATAPPQRALVTEPQARRRLWVRLFDIVADGARVSDAASANTVDELCALVRTCCDCEGGGAVASGAAAKVAKAATAATAGVLGVLALRLLKWAQARGSSSEVRRVYAVVTVPDPAVFTETVALAVLQWEAAVGAQQQSRSRSRPTGTAAATREGSSPTWLRSVRNLAEAALRLHGSSSAALWSAVVRLERAFGTPDTAAAVHWRAVRHLDAASSDRFVDEQAAEHA